MPDFDLNYFPTLNKAGWGWRGMLAKDFIFKLNFGPLDPLKRNSIYVFGAYFA